MMTAAQSPFSTPTAPWQAFKWPALVVALLAGHIFIVTGALVLSSTWIPGASTAPTGYAEALAWDELKAQRLASERLGWACETTIAEGAELNGDRRLSVALRDAAGEPVEGALIDLTLFHLSRPNRPIEARLEPTTVAGEYRAALPLRRSGAWRLSGVATAGADRLLIDTEVWIAPPKRGAIR